MLQSPVLVQGKGAKRAAASVLWDKGVVRFLGRGRSIPKEIDE